MKRIILRIVIVLVVLLVVAVIAVSLSLDGLVKTGVQKIGSNLTKVEVKLDSVNLSLLSGSGKIKGLSVGNPEGYKTPQAITVSNATLELKPSSLLSQKIIITKIEVIAPEVTFEGGLGGNNLSKILANVNDTEQTPAATKGEAKSEGKAGKKLEVDDFHITGAKLHLSVSGMGGSSIPVALPEIHLTDLGKEGDGITKAELTKKVIAAIESAAVKAAAENAGKLGKDAAGLLKGAGGTATNAAGNIGKSIEGLFKKK